MHFIIGLGLAALVPVVFCALAAIGRRFLDFAITGGAKELLGATIICVIVTLLLMPFFPY